ncbi:elongation factor 4, partial [Patescibacteria group bacterium]
SITYEIEYADGKKEMVYSPSLFPDHGSFKAVSEPWIKAKIISPYEYMGAITQLLYEHEGQTTHSDMFGDDRIELDIDMPLRELMRNFFDELKSVSSGFASLSYEIGELKPADVARLDVLVAEEVMPAFSRVVAKRRAEEEPKEVVEKLYKVLPKQQFTVKIQGKTLGRIIASKTLSAMRKDVTAGLYGGDVTRKKKMLEKQKKGKKRLKGVGRVSIPQHVFLKMMK